MATVDISVDLFADWSPIDPIQVFISDALLKMVTQRIYGERWGSPEGELIRLEQGPRAAGHRFDSIVDDEDGC
jgi:hypothetical protein